MRSSALVNCFQVWHISSSFNNPFVFATSYSNFSDGNLKLGCKLWKLPSDQRSQPTSSKLESSDHSSTQSRSSIEEIVDFKSLLDTNVTHVLWKPVESDQQLMSLGDGYLNLWNAEEASPSLIATYQIPEKKGQPNVITNGRWDPHHGAKQFAIACGQAIMSWDVRANTTSFQIEHAHSQLVRDMDFNPNKQYFMATCGDDCQVKFWDIREPTTPVSVIDDQHSHWIWSTRFNPFHDQLVLSCGSDSRVVLYNKASISSEPFGHLIEEDDSDAEASTSDHEKEPIEDGLIAAYDEHEDSVYAVEWSATDPWSFASLSYDGRVVINKVPKKVKFDILL